MAHSWKKQATVAYGYSLTRLALNMYMYFEELPLSYDENGQMQKQLDTAFMDMVAELLDGEPAVQSVDELRNRINSEMEAVVAYMDCFLIYEYALNRIERRYQKGHPVSDMTEDEFVDRVMEFISSAKAAAVMNQRIQLVISQLPVRFTRQKYYGMVHDALSAYIGADKESLENIMYQLRTSGMAELSPEQREAFPELSEQLTRLSELSFKDFTAESFQEAQRQIGLVGVQLFALSDYLQLMADMVNDLYVICLTREDAIRDAAEEAQTCSILKELCALYEAESRDLTETLEEKLWALEGVQESWYEKYQRIDPAPEYRDGEDGSACKSRCVERLLSTSTFASLREDTKQQSAETVERSDVEAAFDDFVSAIDPVLVSSQKPVARAIMAATLSELPICFNSMEETGDYVKNSIGGCTDYAERETCMELLLQLMENEDYALV